MESQKTILRGILTSTPTAITIQELTKEYRNTIGEYIPYQKLGYNSLEHFLRSMPDTVQVQGGGPYALLNPVASEKSSHVMELVSKQKIDKKKASRRMHITKRHVVGSSNNFFKDYSPPVTRPQSQKIFYPMPSNKPLTAGTSTFSNSTNHPSNYQGFNKSVNSNNYAEKKYESSFSANGVLEKPPIIYNTNKTKNDLEQVIKKLEQTNISAPKVLDAENLRRSHSSSKSSDEVYNLKPSYMAKKFNNFKLNTSATSSNLNLSNNLSNSSSNGNNIPKVLMEDPEKYVPLGIKNDLKLLIAKYPDGIWCSEVLGVYREMFKRDLKYQDLGFQSLIDLVICLKSIFHYIRPSNEDYKLYDKSKPLPASAEKNFTAASFSSGNTNMDPTSALPNCDWNNIVEFLPPNSFKPGREIPRTFVPEGTKAGDTIDIMVGEVYDISKFWVYTDDGKLDQLMDDMQVFYDEHSSKYTMPQYLIKEGVYCATIIFGEYHRGLVVDTHLEDTDVIKVLFIDYGTVAKVKPPIYLLHTDFAQLPAQTIRARLADIWPSEEGAPWSHESSVEFRQLIKKKACFTAKISRVNWKNQHIEIFLADVTDPQNVFYINNILVEKGYAVFADQEQKTSIIDSLSTPIVNLIHLFPSFSELELGLAPSTSEMDVFHKCNVPINFCYPQYFNVDFSEEDTIIKYQTEFYETRILKGLRKSLHHQLNIDTSKLEDKQINFSIFGDLEKEIRAYAGDNGESYEETVSDDKCASQKIDLSSISNQNEKWNGEAVVDLKKDCFLSEDIMKDILNICQSTGNVDSEQVPVEDLLSVSEEENNNLILKSTEDFEESVRSFGDHPLLDLSFSRSNSYDSIEYAENENHADFLSYSNQTDLISFEDRDDFQEEYETNNEEASGLDLKAMNSNNPFLSNLDDEDSKEDIVTNNGRLHPTNPFLTHVPELKEDNSDNNSDSTTSTEYVQEVKIEHTWSTVDHVSSDMSISLHSESLESGHSTQSSCVQASYMQPTTPTNVAQINNDFQTAQRVQSAPVGLGSTFNVSTPEFYPRNYYISPQPSFGCAPFYHPVYPSYPHPSFNNPYYSMAQHQLNKQIFLRSSVNVMQTSNISPAHAQKPICPPPGFEPNSNHFKPPQADNVQVKDFYECYNEVLRQKFNY